PDYAREYGAYLNKRVVLHATEKDDKIEVFRLADGQTKVRIERLLSDRPNERFYQRTFMPDETKELWIYGLGDKDVFVVSGDREADIFVRLIGGYGEDHFVIKNRKSVKVYDWKHEEIKLEGKAVKKQLTDLYTTNTFHWRYFKPNTNVFVPTAGFRTDDGLFLGAKDTYTNEGFNGNPFRQKHTLTAKYYFNFRAAELKYVGVFANIFPKWNFELDGHVTSDRYINNFFEFGNETVNNEDSVGRDFYRARVQQTKLSAGIAYHTLKFRTLFESYETEQVNDRLFTPGNFDTQVFDRQNYTGAETSLYYYNDDADDFPTKGLYVSLMGGYKQNISLMENRFGYFGANLKVVRRLIPSGDLVLATELAYRTNIGNNYFFYHAPSIGGDNGLRGFRDERFTGRSYFYQSTDLRVRLKHYVTAVTPVTIGLYGGFDYGRVWQPDESSNVWHTSQGIGLWVGTANYLGLNAGVFNSVEGTFVQFGFGFGF
ncbi:MAG: ShlB/FhaC/HecB family hemolysin secretion/activation protein, partial [Flavobacteriaceae bacterium]